MSDASCNVNADLRKERKKCKFNIEELTNYIDEGVKYTKQRRELENKVLSEKALFDTIPEEYLSHVDKYENAIRKGVLLHRVMENVRLDVDNELIAMSMRSAVSTAVFKDFSPMSLHTTMFIPTIEQQGTKEQREYWLKRAKNMEIIGTYAQTELGHGTFIRGLETQATYDPNTEEFVINSPKLTSFKWWPGGLAHTVNHCIVMARLFTQGKDCGIQPFIVQLRDEQTHIPLPGIKIGEIGAKLGFNTVNNGFLGFNNYRLPRDRMLMKNAQVLKDGTFIASRNSKLAYGAMVFVRVTIVASMARHAARAATVAVRYSAVRRQSELIAGQPEIQILDFVTQQHKLFVVIAYSFAYMVTARWLRDFYLRVRGEIERGNVDMLPQIHTLACGLKAASSAEGTRLVEQCRLACGGHGYMLSSNLPQTYGLATACCTYEGENTVLMLQTARALVKAWKQNSAGKAPSKTEAYLFEKPSDKKWENTVDGIIAGFQRVAARKLESCVQNIDSLMKQGLAYEDAWNQTSVRLVQLSEAHCRAVVLTTFSTEIAANTQSMSAPLRAVLLQLVQLYVLHTALERTGDLLLYASVSQGDIEVMQRQYEEVLAKIRPNAVGLVDAFDIRDEMLQSTLGAYDGRVYSRLMAEALKSPLNQEPVNRSFHTHLKPFMQGKL